MPLPHSRTRFTPSGQGQLCGPGGAGNSRGVALEMCANPDTECADRSSNGQSQGFSQTAVGAGLERGLMVGNRGANEVVVEAEHDVFSRDERGVCRDVDPVSSPRPKPGRAAG